MIRSLSTALSLGAVLVALAGCFNSSAFTPVITDVAQDAASFTNYAVPTGATSALVSGLFFSPGVVVFWDDKPLPTKYQRSSLVQIELGLEQTGIAGTANVTAANDGGLVSSPHRVTIFDAPLAATSLNPPSADPGAGPLTVTITGTGFKPATHVLWNGTALPTTFNSSTSLTATVAASLLTRAGDGFVQVTDVQGCTPPITAPCSTPVLPFRIGPSTRTKTAISAQDMAWDGTHGVLLVAPYSYPTSTLKAIDPATVAVVASTSTRSGGIRLSISAQDVYLYSASVDDPFNPATRWKLPDLSAPTAVPFGKSATTIAAAPDVPETAVFSGTIGYGIVDGTAVRGQPITGLMPAPLMWGLDGSTLFGVESSFSTQLVLYRVDGTGIASRTILNTISAPTGTIKYDRAARLLYDDGGHVFDEQGAAQPSFPVPAGPCRAVMDGALGRVFFFCSEPGYGLTVRSFDVATRQPLSQILVDPPDDSLGTPPTYWSPERIVRFQAHGLALSAGGSLYLYTGDLVR